VPIKLGKASQSTELLATRPGGLLQVQLGPRWQNWPALSLRNQLAPTTKDKSTGEFEYVAVSTKGGITPCPIRYARGQSYRTAAKDILLDQY
jgi:hypothetical protein